jgi:hypothetical protein
MVWDKLLGLNLFAPEIHTTELAFYQKHFNVCAPARFTRRLHQAGLGDMDRNAGRQHGPVRHVFETDCEVDQLVADSSTVDRLV